jgi:GNAT superfamily N-acetyltransferase
VAAPSRLCGRGHAWKEGAVATVEFLGAVDGVDAGSAAAAFEASRTNLVAMLVTVLPQHRRAGVGSALVDAVTTWADEHGAREIETRVEAADEESLASHGGAATSSTRGRTVSS